MYSRFFLILITGVSICICSHAYSEPSGAPDFFLLTPNEAQKLRFSVQEWDYFQQNLAFGFGSTSDEKSPNGPHIIIQNPKVHSDSEGPTIRCASPLSLKVLFQENRAPVNMNSLDVTAKKGIFSKSLMQRLRPFIHQNIISAENIEIPPGRYCVVVSIADLNGATTVKTYGLEVIR